MAIDALREPIEDGVITIARASGTVTMPAKALVVALLGGVGGARNATPGERVGQALRDGVERYTDPLPQALVLTAIVIGFAMTAFILILAIRARADLGNDHVDGRELPPERSAIEEALADRIEKNTAAHKAQHNKSHSRHKRKQS